MFPREYVVNKELEVHYLLTSSVPADIFTKSLCTVKHYKFIDLLGTGSAI